MLLPENEPMRLLKARLSPTPTSWYAESTQNQRRISAKSGVKISTRVCNTQRLHRISKWSIPLKRYIQGLLLPQLELPRDREKRIHRGEHLCKQLSNSKRDLEEKMERPNQYIMLNTKKGLFPEYHHGVCL